MSAHVIDFPHARIVVPLFEESRRFAREIDQRHAARWYRMGAKIGFDARLYCYASEDGRDYLVAYQAGCFARLFGIDLRECVAWTP